VLAGLIGAIVVVILTGQGSPHHQALDHKSSQFVGPEMPAHLRAPNFTLVDQRGRKVTLDHDRGHVVVLTFIHSLCKDACPFMTEQIKGALNELPGRGADVPTIGVSVDPSQDTVHNRDHFLALHQMAGRMQFLNGPLPAMRRVWNDYSIQPIHGRTLHSTFVLLIDKRGYERVGFAADQLTPPGLAHDIRVLERERA
jgi:protein SCO1